MPYVQAMGTGVRVGFTLITGEGYYEVCSIIFCACSSHCTHLVTVNGVSPFVSQSFENGGLPCRYPPGETN